MAILWCGGEDVDFPNGGASASTTTAHFRSSYARCAILKATGTVATPSTAFTAGTSFWLSFRVPVTNSGGANQLYCGLVKEPSSSSGLFVGTTSTAGKIALVKYDGTTKTVLATESGVTGASTSDPLKIDIELVNYGASATVNVYLNGSLLITYSGDVTVTGVTTLSTVGLSGYASSLAYISEIIVASEDTRLMSLCTLAPSAAGDANAWTGAYTDIDEVTISDADELYTNATGNDAQVNLTNLPSGVFTVRAVKVAARVAKSAGATAGSIGLGVKSGGTIDSATAVACDTAWATHERLMAQNPVTSNIWQPSEIDALQLNFRSDT